MPLIYNAKNNVVESCEEQFMILFKCCGALALMVRGKLCYLYQN